MPNQKAKAILQRALKVIPRATQTMSKCYMMWPDHSSFPIFLKSQDGCVVKSIDGVQYIDLMNASGTNFVDPSIAARAIKQQLKSGINLSLPTTLETELAELLCQVIPGCEMVRFMKNGSDATMAAVRAARHIAGKDQILMMSNGYHGTSDGFCAASNRPCGVPSAWAYSVDKVDYNDIETIRHRLETKRYAALIIEPVSIEQPTKNFLDKCLNACHENGALLIFDEIVTFGRFALGGCAELFGVIPDLMTVGKCMGSGMAISAVCGKREYMSAFHDILYSATFAGESLSFASAIATLKYLCRNKIGVYPWVWECGERFKANFNDQCKLLKIKGKAVGMAPRLNVVFKHDNAQEIKDLWHIEMLKRGVLIGMQIYHTPMLTMKHIEHIDNATKESLGVIAEVVGGGNIETYLGGSRSFQVFKR